MGSKDAKVMAKLLVQLYRSTVLGRHHSATVAHSKHSGKGQRFAERGFSLKRFNCRSSGMRKP